MYLHSRTSHSKWMQLLALVFLLWEVIFQIGIWSPILIRFLFSLMSKITGWTKNKIFISTERVGNCLSKSGKVANGSFQGSIEQLILHMCKVTVSNFILRLWAAWKLLMRLEKPSCIGTYHIFISNDATQSLLQQEAALLIFFLSCSFVGLFLLNLLIQRDAGLTSQGIGISCWCLYKWSQQTGTFCFLEFFVILASQRQKQKCSWKND